MIPPATLWPPRPAAASAQSWEALPNGVLVAQVRGYRLVVRKSTGGVFRFVLMKPLSGRGGIAHVTSGRRSRIELAMAAAEKAVAALPDNSPGPTGEK